MPKVKQLITGSCNHCRAVFKIGASNGTVHKHGPRTNPCPGSGQPPEDSTVTDSSQTLISSADSNTPVTQLSQSTLSFVTDVPQSQSASPTVLSHPERRGPLIKRIPRSSRQGCSTLLASLIQKIVSETDSIQTLGQFV